jgi:hypothetical protein
MVYRTKRRFVEDNLEAAPGRGAAARRRAQAVRQGDGTAGRDRLLQSAAGAQALDARSAGRRDGRLTDHEAVSRETVRRRLAEDDLKPWRHDMWCIPRIDGAYVARMEDVLDLYAEPGQPERYDCEYCRNGTANLFVFLDAHRS